MSSKNKSESARLNGSKSQGPKTPEGKARSSKNALRHGLTGDFIIFEHESADDFDRLEEAYIDRYCPADLIELELVQTLATTRWRLRRIANLEANLFQNELALSADQIESDFETINDEARLAVAFKNLAQEGPSLALLIRYESSLNRVYDRTLKQLEQLQNRPQPNEPTDPLTPDPPSTSEPLVSRPENPGPIDPLPACGARTRACRTPADASSVADEPLRSIRTSHQ
jgi:hypothetical protein